MILLEELGSVVKLLLCAAGVHSVLSACGLLLPVCGGRCVFPVP